MIYYTIKFVRWDENNRAVFAAEPIDGSIEIKAGNLEAENTLWDAAKGCYSFCIKDYLTGKQGVQIGLKSSRMPGILRTKPCKDILRHDFGIFRREPDVRIGFMMMPMIMFMAITAFQRSNAGGTVDAFLSGKQICHKILKTCTGNDDELCGFCGTNLRYIQRVVVQAGYIVRYHPGDSDIRAPAQLLRKFIYRQCGGSHFGRFFLGRAACQQEKKAHKGK